jgi:Spx/MgsR family transcriptional regulator
MLKIYGIKNCSTMKKAFDQLDQLGLAYTFHDYKKLGIDVDSLQQWASQVGVDTLLNKKGTTWKKLSEAEQQQALASEAASIAALQQNTSMIKRPVLIAGDKILVGYDEAAYQALLP